MNIYLLLAFIYPFMPLPPLPDIFVDHRITVVVTRMDEMYSEMNENARLSEQKVKQIVSSKISEALCLKVSPDIVVPVSGKWALEVRVYWELWLVLIYSWRWRVSKEKVKGKERRERGMGRRDREKYRKGEKERKIL